MVCHRPDGLEVVKAGVFHEQSVCHRPDGLEDGGKSRFIA